MIGEEVRPVLEIGIKRAGAPSNSARTTFTVTELICIKQKFNQQKINYTSEKMRKKKRKVFEKDRFKTRLVGTNKQYCSRISLASSLSAAYFAICLVLSNVTSLSSSSDLSSSAFVTPPTATQLDIEGASLSNNAAASSSSQTVINQDLAAEQTRQVALQLALVSAKGSIAFWHPQEHSQNNVNLADQDISSLLKSNLHYVKPSSISPIVSRPKGQEKSSCHKTVSSKQSAAAELLTVEGSQIKLNLVILGQRYATTGSTSGLTNDISNVGQAMSKLSLRWTKNYNENISTTTVTSTTSSTSRSSRFNQQIINENDMLRQNYGSQQASLNAGPTSTTNFQQRQSHHHNHRNASAFNKPSDFLSILQHRDYFQQQQNSNLHGSAQTDLMSFMLAPYVNERLISKLARSLQLDTKLFNSINAQIKLAQQQQQHQPGEEVTNVNNINIQDDFLAEGQSIDWQKLESYLRFNSAQLKLILHPSTKLDVVDQQDDQSTIFPHHSYLPPDCFKISLLPNIEQFIVVQVEMSQLTMNDRGLYQLEVCGNNVDCQYLSFYLHVAQDIPILESKPEHQILDIGDRLTIKCEATSFTLPQITWFLDGQQLNEHQFYGTSSSIGQSSMLDILNTPLSGTGPTSNLNGGSIIIGTGSKLRIGDYVSQDNHVHSFVNSSSVQISDGGFYKCQANNGFHIVEHEARVDVRGLPSINRQLNNLSVLVGQNRLQIQCPYSGYPISAIEWYYRPSYTSPSSFSQYKTSPLQQGSIYNDDYLNSQQQLNSRSLVGQFRAKRGPLKETDTFGASYIGNADMLNAVEISNLDADKDPDPDKDEWLSQASAMTQPPNQEDYPEQMPDYSPTGLIPSNFDFRELDSEIGLVDYGDLQMDFQQKSQLQLDDQNDDLKAVQNRRKREIVGNNNFNSEWIKFPQSRRHQVHSNGTLVIQDVSRTDQGYYKCRVLSAQPSGNTQEFSNLNEMGKQQLVVDSDTSSSFVANSNEFYLNTLVAPVISPFTSAEGLREGMRNFLTCSVIEGDSPVRLRWLKDKQAIEDYIQQDLAATTGNGSNQVGKTDQANQARIRVETSNEYTSTLYFSHVDFKDNGNYTCMATNKAASVNYTARMPVNVPPKWIKAPKDLECVSGQNIVIDCQAEAHPNPRVWWEIGVYSQALDLSSPSSSSNNHQINKQDTKNKLASTSNNLDQTMPSQITAANHNHLHPPNHYKTIISNSRIHILENASLVIKDVHKQDQGYYLCQAANNFGSLSSLIKLAVNVGASFPTKYLIKYVKLNERIELDCDPIGQSPVDVIWFMRPHQVVGMKNTSFASSTNNNHQNNGQSDHSSYQNQMISSNHSSQMYDYKKASGSTSGQQQVLGKRLYMATIRTELFHRETKFSSPNSISSGTTSQQLESYIRSQSPLILSSEHTSSDTKNVHDYSDQSSISFELMKRQTENQSEFLRLIIKQAKRQHSTDFVCKATNKFGGDEKLVKLLVQEPPDPVSEITLVQVDSRSMAITWVPPYNGNSPITSYTVEWAPMSNQLFGDNFQASTLPLLLPNKRTSTAPTITTATTTIPPSHLTSNSSTGANNNGLHVKWSQSITSQPALTISSLQPLTSYEIRVRAHNQFGQSSYQSTHRMIATTTEEAPTTPPIDIRAIPLSSSSIQITWLPPTLDNPVQNDALFDSSQLQPPTEELKFDGAKYSIKGYYLGYRISKSNESFVFKTVSLPNQPQIDQGILLAQQEAVIDPPSAYNPLHQNSTTRFGKNQNPTQIGNDNRRLKVVIEDLKRSTKYSIIVQAFNSAGPGPQSDQIGVKTLANDPPPAPLLRVGIVTYTSIELQWSFQIESVNKFEANLASMNNTNQVPIVARYKAIESEQEEESHENITPSLSNALIEGYQLFYRQIDGQWIEKRLTPETHTIIASNHQRNDLSIIELLSTSNSVDSSTSHTTTKSTSIEATTINPNLIQLGWHRNTSLAHKSFRFVLDQLSCGNPYQLYLVAYNSIGSGLRSQVIRTKTRGSAPMAPRKQDYITLNSTYVQLNFDSWMDGGCSIGNFEIRYKQLNGRSSGGIGSSPQSKPSPQTSSPSSHSMSNNEPNNQQWLLLSNNISPEQRMIELRDLQPETWYSILTTAESAAGKTEVQHSFMTLDKFGQLPAEAVESASNLPALFRNNASIRSILYNFTSSGNNVMSSSSLIMSACLALILFATCSLFLIRRYNNMTKDSVSLDSQTTNAVLSSTSQFHGNNQRYHHHNHHFNNHRQQHIAADVGGYSNMLHLDDSNSFDTHTNNNKQTYGLTGGSEHYSLKVSPCKTTTATIITGSSTNDSSGIMTGSSICNDELATNSHNSYSAPTIEQQNSLDLNQFINNNGENPDHNNCTHPQYLTTSVNNHRDGLEDFCSASCVSPSLNSSSKFSTIIRNNNNMEQMQQQALIRQQTSRFKTMPHQARPVSSFIPNGNYQNSERCFYNNQKQQLTQNDDYQHHLNNQQQIYSKLRLIYNSNSNYNICPESQKEVSVEYPSQLYNADTSHAQAMLSQQKVLNCNLKGGGQQQQQQLASYLPNGFNNQIPETSPNELTSLLLECQQQQQQHQMSVDANEGYSRCQNGQQMHLSGQQVDANYLCSVPSISSNSTSTNKSNQTAPASSVNSSHNSDGSHASEQQLINMTDGNNNKLTLPVNQQCSKLANQMKVNNTNQQQNMPTIQPQSQSQSQPQLQQQLQQANQPTTNEQSDYALPFPPKWV